MEANASQHPLLASLSEEQRASFLQIAAREEYTPGEVIFREGDFGDALYLILDGEVEISKLKHSENKDTKLAVLGPNEFFGEMTLVEPGYRSATARCLTPATLLRLSNETLKRQLEQDPKYLVLFLMSVIRVLSHRLRTTSDILVGLKSGIEKFYHFG